MFKRIPDIHQIGYQFVGLLFVFIFLIPLFQQGMFIDGQQYATVAMNAAHGKGTFWHPYLTETWGYFGETAFMEQPPLGFKLQSYAFRLLGDSFLTERIYNLFLFIFSAFLLLKLWNLIKGENAFRQGWMVILFYLSIGTTSWVFHNNVWEAQMAVFCLLSVLATIKAFKAESNKTLILQSALAGVFIVASAMTKGVPGLFPLAAPFGLLIFRQVKKVAIIQLLVTAVVFLMFIGIYHSSAEATEAIDYYVQKRLIERIDSQPTVTSHFHILNDLFGQLIPILILSIIPFFTKFKPQQSDEQKKWIYYFLFVGFTATLPLMLTLIQRGFYLFPGYYYYIIAFAFLVGDSWQSIVSRIGIKTKKTLHIVTLLGIVCGVALTIITAGNPGRDAQKLADIEILKDIIPSNEVVYYNTYKDGNAMDMGFYMYVARFTDFELAVKIKENTAFCLQNKGDVPRDGYELIPTELNGFDLYKKTE